MSSIMSQLIASLEILTNGIRMFEDDRAGKIKKGILEDGINVTTDLIKTIADKDDCVLEGPIDTTKNFENTIIGICEDNLDTEAAKKMFSAMALMEAMLRNMTDGKE